MKSIPLSVRVVSLALIVLLLGVSIGRSTAPQAEREAVVNSPINLNPGDQLSGSWNCPGGLSSLINPGVYSLNCLNISTPTPAPTSTTTPSGKPTTANASVVPSATPGKGSPSGTPGAPTLTPGATIVPPSGDNQPFPSALLCEHGEAADTAHDKSMFHTLWNNALGCHYDHEHGESPFTPEVAAAFPGFNLPALLGGVGIGHTNPSSPTENVAKHGGFKWQADIAVPSGCLRSFEDGDMGVKAYAIQFHAFGRQNTEHEVRNHSSASLLTLCKIGNPNDVGYMYVTQLQEYGQRVMPYQGLTLQYPDNFSPQYISPRGPYFTNECEGPDTTFIDVDGSTRLVDCRDRGDTRNNNNSIWTSKPTQSSGPRERPITPTQFRMLFRGRDLYQRIDIADLTHPFTWDFVCGNTTTYNPTGCRFNSSTFTIHEVMGDIPAAWDGKPFDTDPRPGRISLDGYVNLAGEWNPECTGPSGNCFRIVLISMFPGRYSAELSVEKVSNPTPENTPERDIYFCNGVPCLETSPGAVPSGWIGSEN